jgi:hypothetical protein
MKSQKKQRMGLVAAGALALGMCLAATSANATTITASVGGVPTGADCYENFNSLTLGGASGTTSACGINVSFSPQGGVVQGSVGGQYAAPVLSNGNGALFGDPDGADASKYLTAGGTSGSLAQLILPTSARYLGLLWGSVDNYNHIAFYMGSTLVYSFSGSAVSAAAGNGNCANGNQSTVGTCYVNINLSEAFDKVVMTSDQYAFEFDNVAFAASPLGVPEPGEIGLFLLGLGLIGSGYWFRKRRLA